MQIESAFSNPHPEYFETSLFTKIKVTGGRMDFQNTNKSIVVLVVCLAAMILTQSVMAGEKDNYEGEGRNLITSVPRSISYQGILKDSGGDPVADSVYSVMFRIFNVESGGTSLWDETVPCTTSAGVFDAALSNVNLPFDEDYWLELEVGGEILDPRQKMHMVGYAAVSDTSDYAFATAAGGNGWVDDGNVVRLETDTDSVGIGTATPAEKLHIEGDIYISGTATIGTGHIINGSDNFTAGTSNGFNGNSNVINGGANSQIYGDYNSIGGGQSNAIQGDNSVIAGGRYNYIEGQDNTIGGGYVNDIGVDYNGTISGGVGNQISFPGVYSSIGGGAWNNSNGVAGVVAGGYNNEVAAGADSSAVAGGVNNMITGINSFVGGGSGNTAGGLGSTVAGGINNVANSPGAAVAGGEGNLASGHHSAVVGGSGNQTGSEFSFIGGGLNNYAPEPYTTLGGGLNNYLGGYAAIIGGGENNEITNDFGFIGGGEFNSLDGVAATLAGGSHNLVYGDYSAILGGYADTITYDGDYSYLFGIGSKLTQDSTFMVDMPHIRFGDESTGYEFPPDDGSYGQLMSTDGAGQLSWTTINIPEAGWSDDGSVVRLNTSGDSVGIGTSTPTEKLDVNGNIKSSGTIASGGTIIIDGINNEITSTSGTISFNNENLITTGKATIGSGHTNTGTYAFVAGTSNTVSQSYTTVGGGWNNTSSGYGATIGGGGYNNSIEVYSTVGGGAANNANGHTSTVAGGGYNTASVYATTISGGYGNTASGDASTIGGGIYNIASGGCSVVPGGCNIVAAGDYSMAAGSGARALHKGSLVWADASNDEFSSSNENQIMMLASGGTWIYADPDLQAGVTIHPGASAWSTYSDVNLKENLNPVNGKEILQKISSLPISEWNLKAQNDNIRHIGPTAQDFHNTFGLGESENTISTVDADGVALAGIKELIQENRELRDLISQLERRITELENR